MFFVFAYRLIHKRGLQKLFSYLTLSPLVCVWLSFTMPPIPAPQCGYNSWTTLFVWRHHGDGEEERAEETKLSVGCFPQSSPQKRELSRQQAAHYLSSPRSISDIYAKHTSQCYTSSQLWRKCPLLCLMRVHTRVISQSEPVPDPLNDSINTFISDLSLTSDIIKLLLRTLV